MTLLVSTKSLGFKALFYFGWPQSNCPGWTLGILPLIAHQLLFAQSHGVSPDTHALVFSTRLEWIPTQISKASAPSLSLSLSFSFSAYSLFSDSMPHKYSLPELQSLPLYLSKTTRQHSTSKRKAKAMVGNTLLFHFLGDTLHCLLPMSENSFIYLIPFSSGLQWEGKSSPGDSVKTRNRSPVLLKTIFSHKFLFLNEICHTNMK